VKYNIFKRINTGGLVLEPAEIRHALNQGVASDFVKGLSESPEFLDATSRSIPTERMLDRDFIARFLSFYLHPYTEYKGNMEEYLNNAIGELKDVAPIKLDEIKKVFKSSMKVAKDIFGKHAFRKLYKRNDRRKPLNKALFEVWSVSLAKLSDEQKTKLISSKDFVIEQQMTYLNSFDKKLERAISTGTADKQNVINRFELINSIILNALSHD